MDYSEDSFNELFDQRAGANAELGSFDFSQLNAGGSEGDAQSSWLFSEDPNLWNQQVCYNDVVIDEFLANSISNSDNYASSFQPKVQPPASSVQPESLSSLLQLSSNIEADLELFPALQEAHAQEQAAQAQQYRCVNPQSLERVRFEPERLPPDNVEQVRAEQHRVEQAGANPLIVLDLEEAESSVAFEAVKNDLGRLNKLPHVQAAAVQEPRGNLNQIEHALDDKTARRIRDAKNSRSANMAEFVAAEHFIPLPDPPQSWGKINPETGRPMFEYSPQGELIPHVKFDEQQIRDYLTNHPLHVDGLLTLWVQICPADSGGRYPDKKHSSKCRFENCIAPKRKIAVGDYRIAFDEQSWKHLPLDPFHNAGYVHLYCLEKHFDFPQLCNDFNVQPDTRSTFAGKKSRMAITRDYPEMEKVVKDFIRDSQPWNGCRNLDTWYSKSLCYALTVEQLKREPRTRQAKRDERDGNSVDKHMGNLDLQQENSKMKKEGLPWKFFEEPVIEKRQTKKRKFDDDDEEEEADAGANQAGSLAKKRKITQQAYHIEKPQTRKRKFDEEEAEVNQSGPSAKKPRFTQQSSRFKKPEVKSILPMKKPQPLRSLRSLKRQPDWSSSAKRPKVMEEVFENGSAYDEHVSNSPTSSIEERKESWGKHRVAEERRIRLASPVKRHKYSKRKIPELEEGDGDLTGEIQEVYFESMKRYGLNKGHQKGAAGLKTPLGDMLHLSY